MGAEGLPVRDGEQLLLADGAPAFAQAVTRVLEDGSLANRLSVAGRLLLEESFTWDAVWKNLDL